MSILKVTFSFIDNKWTIENNLVEQYSTIQFHFESYDEMTPLKHVRFGYVLNEEEETVSSNNYPPTGVKYNLVNKTAFIIEDITVTPEKNYHVSVFLQTDNETFTEELSFTGPIPERPYPSWTWTDGTWQAPSPIPPGPHIWNETTKVWDKAEEDFPYPEN